MSSSPRTPSRLSQYLNYPERRHSEDLAEAAQALLVLSPTNGQEDNVEVNEAEEESEGSKREVVTTESGNQNGEEHDESERNIEGDVEEWELYDEDEGHELEAALEESMEKFAGDLEELELVRPSIGLPEEVGEGYESEREELVDPSALTSFQNISGVDSEGISVRNLPTITSMSSIPTISSQDRQQGLLDIRVSPASTSGSAISDASSEVTWPKTALPNVDNIIRSYLPGLYAEDCTEEEEEEQSAADSVSETPLVLEADNPMMAKFQDMLRDHLLRQISKVKAQVSQIEADTKRLTDESRVQADSVIREDKFVQKQRENVEAYRANIEQLQSRREAFEKDVAEKKESHSQMKGEYSQMNSLDRELVKEREMLNDLVNKMRTFEAERTQILITSQNLSNNQQCEMKKLADEKMKQDMLLWKLEKEIIRLNNEIDRSATNCDDMQKETSCLEDLLKKVEDDSAGLEAENRLLQSSIMKMYGAIKDCDSRKLGAQQTLETRINNYNLIVKNKMFWKKALKQEYEEMENLETKKNDLLTNLDQQRTKLIRLEEQTQMLEREIERKHTALNLAEDEKKNLEKEEIDVLKLKHNLDLEVSAKVNEMEGLKRTLNGVLLEKQVTQKGIGYLEAEIRKLGELNKHTEEKIVDSELALAKALLDMERARSQLLQSTGELNNSKKISRNLEQDVRETKSLKKRLTSKLNLITNRQHMLERKLDAKNRADPENAIDKNQTAENWAETKLKRMQEALKLVTALTKKLSDGWFNLQNVIMKRKEDRTRQIHQLNIKRKHCHTMDSCQIRLERNLTNVKHTISRTRKEISKEQRLCERWQGDRVKAAEKLDRLDKTNGDLENRFVDEISEAEKEARNLNNEIDRLRADIESLGRETTRLQTELLDSEKRKELAEITKLKIDQFQAPDGEVGQLKQEIHRMEVRYSHLKKAEEKLMADLELCITRRDRMIDNAEAREVRSQTTGKQWSRMQVQRKMNDFKTKIQTLKRKNTTMNKEQVELSYRLAESREEYDSMKVGLDTLRINLEELERQIEEGQLHKHACLEATLYRQMKAKYLEDYKFGRYKTVHKTAGVLLAEEEKQTRLAATLTSVLENLLNDFPRLSLQILQIMNTLQPTSVPERDDKATSSSDSSLVVPKRDDLVGISSSPSVDNTADIKHKGPRRLPENYFFPLKALNWTALM